MVQPEPIPQKAVDGRELGRRIAQARYESGWMTQKTLAELLCVCKRSIQAYEAGKTIPYRHLHRLEEIFERPASWFLYGTEPSNIEGRPAERPDDQIVERLAGQTRVLKALATEVREMRRTLDALSAPSSEDGPGIRAAEGLPRRR